MAGGVCFFSLEQRSDVALRAVCKYTFFDFSVFILTMRPSQIGHLRPLLHVAVWFP